MAQVSVNCGSNCRKSKKKKENSSIRKITLCHRYTVKPSLFLLLLCIFDLINYRHHLVESCVVNDFLLDNVCLVFSVDKVFSLKA